MSVKNIGDLADRFIPSCGTRRSSNLAEPDRLLFAEYFSFLQTIAIDPYATYFFWYSAFRRSSAW